MTNLDQLADEANALRSYYLGAGTRSPDEDREIARRVLRLLDFTGTYPALDQMAEHRLTALAKLATKGITPDRDTTATSGDVHLATIQDQPPVQHRYTITRDGKNGPEAIGVAWLSTDPGWPDGTYVVRLHDRRGGVYGRTLAEALQRMATDLADTERADRKAGAR